MITKYNHIYPKYLEKETIIVNLHYAVTFTLWWVLAPTLVLCKQMCYLTHYLFSPEVLLLLSYLSSGDLVLWYFSTRLSWQAQSQAYWTLRQWQALRTALEVVLYYCVFVFTGLSVYVYCMCLCLLCICGYVCMCVLMGVGIKDQLVFRSYPLCF